MEYTELNPEGNFESWQEDKLEELKKKDLCETMGNLMFENDMIMVSELTLLPNDRMPFRKRRYNYSATALTDGLIISRNGNGMVTMLRFKKGDIAFWKFNSETAITDLQNIGTSSIKAIIVAYKDLGVMNN